MNVPLGLCGVPVKDSRPCLKGSGRLQLVPGLPLSATLSGPRTVPQTGQRQRLKTRLGQALKNVLAARPTRKSISRLQPAALPRTRPSRGCCDSKTQCHGNGCATPGAGCLESRAGPFGWVLHFVSAPIIPLLFCCAWRGLTLDPEALLLQGDLRASSLFSCQEASTAGTRAPYFGRCHPAPCSS